MSSHNKSRECIKLRETINKVYCGKGNTSCFFKIKNPEEEKAHSWANWLHAKEPLLRKIPRSQLKKVLQMSLELNIAAWQISVCKNPNQESVWHDDVSSNLSELLKIKRSIERLAPNDSSSELSEAFRRSTTTLYDNDTVYIAEFAVKSYLEAAIRCGTKTTDSAYLEYIAELSEWLSALAVSGDSCKKISFFSVKFCVPSELDESYREEFILWRSRSAENGSLNSAHILSKYYGGMWTPIYLGANPYPTSGVSKRDVEAVKVFSARIAWARKCIENYEFTTKFITHPIYTKMVKECREIASSAESQIVHAQKNIRNGESIDNLMKIGVAVALGFKGLSSLLPDSTAASDTYDRRIKNYDNQAYRSCRNQRQACLAQCRGLPHLDPGQTGFSQAWRGGGPRWRCESGCRKISC